MDQVKGLDVGTSYLNRKMAMEFSIAIAQTEVSKLVAKFRKSKFFSLVLDEATDVQRLEQCIAYTFSARGEIFTKFRGIRYAEQITDCILGMLKDIPHVVTT